MAGAGIAARARPGARTVGRGGERAARVPARRRAISPQPRLQPAKPHLLQLCGSRVGLPGAERARAASGHKARRFFRAPLDGFRWGRVRWLRWEDESLLASSAEAAPCWRPLEGACKAVHESSDEFRKCKERERGDKLVPHSTGRVVCLSAFGDGGAVRVVHDFRQLGLL